MLRNGLSKKQASDWRPGSKVMSVVGSHHYPLHDLRQRFFSFFIPPLLLSHSRHADRGVLKCAQVLRNERVWWLPWRYHCFLLFIAIPALRLASTEGKFGFKALAPLAFRVSSTTLHHGFQFPVTNNKGSLCICKRFMVRQCSFGHRHLLGSTACTFRPVDCSALRDSLLFTLRRLGRLRMILSIERMNENNNESDVLLHGSN
ncbi:predicted protein [Lichtheimia corymbifera JMRC:FSU:9682]|uniref:Uncharacterized protein n=1 Tax=Lichtheimia corymbifera JMRC:FSU:9682 TaxID=1263082 RepID=A0A068RGV2_9FUNG|nr:predicted protein [Lichtheimia corymbifera JMRC:FSU:9682]